MNLADRFARAEAIAAEFVAKANSPEVLEAGLAEARERAAAYHFAITEVEERTAGWNCAPDAAGHYDWREDHTRTEVRAFHCAVQRDRYVRWINAEAGRYRQMCKKSRRAEAATLEAAWPLMEPGTAFGVGTYNQPHQRHCILTAWVGQTPGSFEDCGVVSFN